MAAQVQARPEDYTGRRSVEIPMETLRRLSELNPYRALAQIIVEWGIVFTTIWLAWRFMNPVVYILAVFVIGGRQQVLATLLHDGSHFLLVKNKSLNDWITDIFIGWPSMVSIADYRSTHWEHHRFTNTEKDPDCVRFAAVGPDYEFPMSWGQFGVMSLKDFLGYPLVALTLDGYWKTAFIGVTPQRRYARLTFYLVFLITAITFGFWKQYLLFWFVPSWTSSWFFLRVRSIAEHFGTENDHPLNFTRTTIPSWWEYIFIGNNINYHLDHHIFPSVPFYRLRELHASLMEQESFKKHAHVTQSYLGVLKECVALKGNKRSCLRGAAPQTTTD